MPSMKCVITHRVQILAAHRHSKVINRPRLVERKVFFISDAGKWGTGGGGHLS